MRVGKHESPADRSFPLHNTTYRMDTPVRRTRYDRIIEILSLLCLLATFVPLLFYNNLDKGILIPIHYNNSGQIDGWGDRSYLWNLPVVASAIYVVLSIIERFYKKFRYPVQVTTNNAPVLYKLAVRMIRQLKLNFLLIFAYLNIFSFATAMGKVSGVNGWIMTGLIAGLFVTLFVYYIKMVEAKYI